MSTSLCTSLRTSLCTSLRTSLRTSQCTYCKTKTNICNYSFRYKKNICSNCINFIRACSHCNEWYTSGLIRYNEKLFCIKCLTDFNDIIIKPTKCCTCNKFCTDIITHHDKQYCMQCITQLSQMYKKLK